MACPLPALVQMQVAAAQVAEEHHRIRHQVGFDLRQHVRQVVAVGKVLDHGVDDHAVESIIGAQHAREVVGAGTDGRDTRMRMVAVAGHRVGEHIPVDAVGERIDQHAGPSADLQKCARTHTRDRLDRPCEPGTHHRVGDRPAGHEVGPPREPPGPLLGVDLPVHARPLIDGPLPPCVRGRCHRSSPFAVSVQNSLMCAATSSTAGRSRIE